MNPVPGWHKAKDAVLNLVFPPRCVGCDRGGDWLCRECIAGFEYVQPPVCSLCGRPLTRGSHCNPCSSRASPLLGIRAVAYLAGTLRQAIHRFKYKGTQVLAPHFAELLAQTWRRAPADTSVIVPVPLHPERLRQRGYNQSALLGRELGKRIGLPVLEGSLLRLRSTRPQVGLGTEERRRNVQGAFGCRDDRVANEDVLLVDDVCTTGATLGACAQALLDQGAGSAWALVLARERAPTGFSAPAND